MNRDDVIRMAKEAGPLISTPFDVWCERFAALIEAAEQERFKNEGWQTIKRWMHEAAMEETKKCADICRAWPDGDMDGLAEAILSRYER